MINCSKRTIILHQEFLASPAIKGTAGSALSGEAQISGSDEADWPMIDNIDNI
jgi:hypothetical protein